VLTVRVPGVLVLVDPEQVGKRTAPDGPETLQARVTLPLKPPAGTTVTVEVAEPPGLTVAGLSAVALSEKVCVVPWVYLTTKASIPPPGVNW
jgi:hypothetical protein